MGQTSTRWSCVPVTTSRPSGENAPQVIDPLLQTYCRSSAGRAVAEEARHNCSRPPALPLVRIVLPSGEYNAIVVNAAGAFRNTPSIFVDGKGPAAPFSQGPVRIATSSSGCSGPLLASAEAAKGS
jgi:hypothetical protein